MIGTRGMGARLGFMKQMSEKQQEALAMIAMTVSGAGMPRKGFHHATIASLLRNGAIEEVPGDPTSVRVPKVSAASVGTTELRDPADEEFPQGACAICGAPILYVHAIWIGTDGNQHCQGTDVPHAVALVRDEAQDALEAEQARTGVHAECGMPMAVHCASCDVCPIPSERCGCGPEGTIGNDELTTITIAPYDGPSVIRTVPTPTADDVAKMADPVAWARDTLALGTLRIDEPAPSLIPETERRALASILGVAPRVRDYQGERRWEAQRIRYAMRVANGCGEIGSHVHRDAYLATLERGYPKHKASKHPRNRKGN
jgi:hypothetical protein